MCATWFGAIQAFNFDDSAESILAFLVSLWRKLQPGKPILRNFYERGTHNFPKDRPFLARIRLKPLTELEATPR